MDGKKWNPDGMMLAMVWVPTLVIPAKFRVEMRPPVEGSLALQFERGVATTKLQPLRSEARSNSNGSIIMENVPSSLVLALESSFPPQTSCTWASEIL